MNKKNKLLKMALSAVQTYEEQPSLILHILPQTFLQHYLNKATEQENMLSVDEY